MLVLTSQCNLRCSYCFENAKKPGRMEWRTLRAALDLAFEHGQRKISVAFTGGEPLLEFDLIKKAVAYTRNSCPGSKRLSFVLVTNGTLLTAGKAAFLAEHSVDTQLSFDGVSAAQKWRGRGTFNSLDSLLQRLHADHPDFYRKWLRVGTTIAPQTIEHMADSVKYFLDRRVHNIRMGASMLAHTRWNPDGISRFEGQFARICDMSLVHFDLTGEVPFALFGPVEVKRKIRGPQAREGRRPAQSPQARSEGVCAAARGDLLSVDVDGDAYACVMFTRSYQTMRTNVLRRATRAMTLGNLNGSRFWERYRSLGESAGKLEVFAPGEKKYSSYRKCRDCRYLEECYVCPVSAGYLPRNRTGKRVPDFTCAFNYTGLKYRERFRKKLGL